MNTGVHVSLWFSLGICPVVNCWVIVVVKSLIHVELFATPWTAACQAPLSCTISQSLLKLKSTESMMLEHMATLFLVF